MKKIYGFILLLFSTGAFAQDQVDSLRILLESAGDTARIEILRELCWATRYSNPPEALKYGLEALSLLKEINIPKKEAEISNFAGIIQRNVGDHANALEYFNDAQRIALNYGLRTELAYAYNNIGDIYNREGKYSTAIDYELKALDLFVLLDDSSGISYVCHQLSLTHANLGNYEVALGYDMRSMRIREQMGNVAGVG